MVKLGTLMPKTLQDSAIDNKLLAGSVIYVQCDFSTPPKEKYLVVLRSSPKVSAYVINSEINPYTKHNRKKLKCQIAIEKSDYVFLDRDSVINCFEVKTEDDIGNLRGKMIEDMGIAYRGRLKKSTVKKIIKATKSSSLTKKEQDDIIRSLKAIVNDLEG